MKHTEETKRKISESLKGRIISEEERIKISESHKGKNSGENHYPKHIPEETRRKISETLKGRFIGEKNPNFGKPMQEHVKQKLLESHLGKRLSEETKAKMRVSHMGHPVSEEHKRKIGDAQKGNKNHCFGKQHSYEHKKKQSVAQQGDKCHLWKGGVSFFPYCEKFNNSRRRATRNFFGNRCIVCGSHMRELQRNLHVHHIDHDKDSGCSGKPFNLVPLCHRCHAKEQFNQEEYKSYINRTLEEGFKWGIWNREQYDLEVMYPEQSEVEMMITETTLPIPVGV